METASVAAILTDAKALLASRPYQTRFIAALDTGELEYHIDRQGKRLVRPRWLSCSPSHPQAMLSFRGAIIAVTGGGRKAWRIFDLMNDWRITPSLIFHEPQTKREALLLFDECLKHAGGRFINKHAYSTQPAAV